MKNRDALENAGTRRALPFVVTALLAAFAVSAPQLALAQPVTPTVPEAIQVPAGNEPFLEGRAVGTQNYVCLPAADAYAWTLVTPQATLFDDAFGQLTTHFLSPNPQEGGTARPTWQSSLDTSSVWARAVASSSDPAFVAPGAIPWLLLQVVGAQAGPTGGDALTATTFIQRLNTSGGVAPSTGCSKKKDVGTRAFVPYTADYLFYAALSN